MSLKGLGLLHPSCSSLSCPGKTEPTLPLLHVPPAHPSLLPFPANFLNHLSSRTPRFTLSVPPCPSSPPQSPKHPPPRCTLHDSLSRGRSSSDTTIRPVVRITNLNCNPLPPSPSAVYPGHSKSFDFTTKSLKKIFLLEYS